ncbi:MAG: WD40/YVTN/BNR-like repeat-containing protein, partial [Chloroflexia bacterium]
MHARLISKRVAVLFASLVFVALGSALVASLQSSNLTPSRGRLDQTLRLDRFASALGIQPAAERDNPTEGEAFWIDRLTYPTGRYDPRWLLRAAEQDRLVPTGVPAGQAIYSRAQSRSPLALDPTRFTSLGPQSVSAFGRNWSGRVNSIAFDPVVTSTAYLAVNGGGVWKTTNCCTESTTFAPLTDGPDIPIIGVDDVIVDPRDHNVVYAGTGDLNFTIPQIPSAGILKSTDQGSTWTVLGADAFAPPYPQPPGAYPQDQAVGKVRLDPRDNRHIVAGTARGVFFSYDSGANWSGPCYTNPYTTTQRQDTTGLLLRDNGTSTDIYVAVGTRAFSVTVTPIMAENGADGIYRTTLPSSGCPASWTLISRPDNGWPAGTGGGVPVRQGGNMVGRIDMAFSPPTEGPGNPNVTIYAQAQSASTLGQLGLWRSTDSGDTWERRSTASALGGCGQDFGQNWFDQYVTPDPNDARTLYMGTYDVWKSTDSGTTFTSLTCSFFGGIVHPDQHALAIAPGTTNVMLAGNDGGVYLTTDTGKTWVDLNTSLSTLEIYGGDTTGNFANAPEPGAAGGTQDNGSMVNTWTSGSPGPAQWTNVMGGDGYWSRIEPVLGQRWYMERNDFDGQRHILMSENGPNGGYQDISAYWVRARAGFFYPYELYKFDCPPTGCTHMIMGTSAVSETLTGAGDWITVSPVFTGYINQLSYSVSLSTTAIVALSNGAVEYGFGLGRAQMGTWVDVSGGNTVLPNRLILDVTTDPVNPLVGYAVAAGFDANTPATPGHVFQVTCTAGCASFTWANKSGNLPDIPVDSVLANPRYPRQVFIGTDWGLYYTNDITVASPVWARFDAGLPHVMIYDMTIDAGFTTLAVWTRSRGGYAWPLPGEPWPPLLTPSVTPTRPTSTPTRTATTPSTATTPPTLTPTRTATSPASTSTAPAATPCAITFTDVLPTDYFYQP